MANSFNIFVLNFFKKLSVNISIKEENFKLLDSQDFAVY